MAPDSQELNSNPEDEDIFDFPKAEHPLSQAVDKSLASVAEADLLLDEDDLLETLADIEALADSGELDLFEEEIGIPTPTPGPQAEIVVPASPAPASAPAANQADDELDEDLFDFDKSFLVQLSQEVGSAAADDSPAAASVAAAGAAAPAPATSGKAPSKKAAKKAAKSSESTVTSVPGLPQTDLFDMQPGATGPLVPMGHEDGRRGRLLELLAVGFIIINTGLVLLAWRAGSQFQDTLLQVTKTIGEAASQRPAQAASMPADSAPIEAPVVEAKPIEPLPSAEQDTEMNLPAQDQPTLAQLTLNTAEKLMEDGKHEQARLRLFRLLANQDRAALPDDIVRGAEILIARSVQLQADALREAGQ